MSEEEIQLRAELLSAKVRIAELEAESAGLRKYRSFVQKRLLELERRIERAIPLVGHKSLYDQLHLLAILEGNNNENSD